MHHIFFIVIYTSCKFWFWTKGSWQRFAMCVIMIALMPWTYYLLSVCQDVMGGTCFTLLAAMASFNEVELGGKRGFTHHILPAVHWFPCVLVPFPKGNKVLTGGEASGVHGYWGLGRTNKNWSRNPAKTLWAQEAGSWGIPALEVTEGTISSRVWRRFYWIFLQPRKSLLDWEQPWRKNLTSQTCSWQAKQGNCLQTPEPTFCLSQELVIWKKSLQLQFLF